ncbi:MAG: DUF3987 domain-containing protein [Firmicutes bacterium]|nr:DUF3987 domain-containing protein [Bacillota bacterium]
MTGAALSCLSVAVGTRCVINNRIYGNLWLLLIGPSSVARKTTSINLARLLCRKANLPIFPDRITPESFYESLASNPEGLFTLSELSGWLGNINRSYARGLKADLTELYDGNYFERMRKTPKGEIIKYAVEKPYICLLAASTLEWFEIAVKEEDSAGGFLPRFHFILGTPRAEYKIPPVLEVPVKLVEHLHQVARVSANVKISESIPVDKATEYYLDWVDGFNQKVKEINIPHLFSYAERIKASVFKTAILLEADTCARKGRASFEKWMLPSVLSACELADYYLSTACKVIDRLTFSDFERLVRKIKDIIYSKKGGVTQRDLLRAAKVPKAVLEEAVEYLIGTELIEKSLLPTGRGPKTVLYFPKL